MPETPSISIRFEWDARARAFEAVLPNGARFFVHLHEVSGKLGVNLELFARAAESQATPKRVVSEENEEENEKAVSYFFAQGGIIQNCGAEKKESDKDRKRRLADIKLDDLELDL